MRATVLALACAVVVAGCGDDGPPPLASACTAQPEALVTALRTAPAQVALSGDARLSRCIADADSDADLLNVGLTFHRAAEALRERAAGGDAQAAVALGYLIGATRRGARQTNGVLDELRRRLEGVGGHLLSAQPATRVPLEEGIAAGARLG